MNKKIEKIRYLGMVALVMTMLISSEYGRQADWLAVGALSALKLLLIGVVVGLIFVEVLRMPGKD